MKFQTASPASVAAFLGITAFVVSAYVVATGHAARRAGIDARRTVAWFVVGLAGELALLAGAITSDVFERYPMPAVPLGFVTMNAAAVAFALSPAGGRIARWTPLAALVGFQAFRFPLELVLHAWAEQGTVPETMTWTGSNLDVLSGVVAAVAAPFTRRAAVAWLANVVGFVLLVNVARVALLSSPVPFGWDVEPKLLLIGHLPYALIGPVCVGGALAGHVLVTRRLLAEARAAS